MLSIPPAIALTRVVYTGTVSASTSNALRGGSSPAYSLGQTFQVSFTINEAFNPSLNSCYDDGTTKLYTNNATCNQSLFSNITFTGQSSGTFNSVARGVQIEIPNASFDSNIGFSRNTFEDNSRTGPIVNSNTVDWNLVSWNVPTAYTFVREPTPYMVSPYGPTLLSPTALISWYYNTSYYRNYALSNRPDIFLTFLSPSNSVATLYFSATQMDIIGEAPAPLPFLGAASAFGFSRRLRRRCRPSCKPISSSSSGK